MKINDIENNKPNYDKSMTVFFNKRTGEVKYVITGIQDMSSFDNVEPDLKFIWDYEILPRNIEVLMNPEAYMVVEGQLYINSDMKEKIMKIYER